MDEALPAPKYDVGHRVKIRRVWESGNKNFMPHATVVSWRWENGRYCYKVRKDGRKGVEWYWEDRLLPGTTPRPFTDAAIALAKGVLEGNTDLVYMLVDEVMEYAKRGA